MTYKVILETPQFNDEELKIACELCIDGGADFVKPARALGRNGCPHHRSDLKALKGRAKIKAFGRHPDAGNRGRDAGSGRCPLRHRHE